MRKLICIVLLVMGGASAASAQHYIGVKGGYGTARGRIYTSYGTIKGTMLWDRYTAGVMWKYYSATPTWGGIAAELEYQQRGYRALTGTGGLGDAPVITDSTAYRALSRTVSSITLPLIWQPHVYLMNRKVRIYASLGVSLSYNTGIGDKYTATRYEPNKIVDDEANKNMYHWGRHTVISETTPYKMQTARDVRWNYGWLGGAGINVIIGKWEVFAEGRYYYGMSDILRTKTKYQFDTGEVIRSELDNIYITMGVYFRLGKGGILAPPRKRSAPTNSDDFRNIKLDM